MPIACIEIIIIIDAAFAILNVTVVRSTNWVLSACLLRVNRLHNAEQKNTLHISRGAESALPLAHAYERHCAIQCHFPTAFEDRPPQRRIQAQRSDTRYI